jgi:hypothetical protein
MRHTSPDPESPPPSSLLRKDALHRRDARLTAWDGALTRVTGALLVYGILSGLAVWLLPFSVFSQLNVLAHTAVGLATVPLLVWYGWRHWHMHRRARLNHNQLLGYGAMALVLICLGSGLALTWQGAAGARIGRGWQAVHLYSGVGFGVLLVLHLLAILVHRRVPAGAPLSGARRRFFRAAVLGTGALVLGTALWAHGYRDPGVATSFVEGYDWRYGPDQPFLPSLARLDNRELRDEVRTRVARVLPESDRATFLAAVEAFERNQPARDRTGLERLDHQARDDLDEVKARIGVAGVGDAIRHGLGALSLTAEVQARVDRILQEAVASIREAGAVDPRALARSSECGRCHVQIYEEWLPSAHRYASLDVSFQAIQELTAEEVNPAATRYCAGCHDPISLFAGAKNPQEITLSAEGFDEGISCVACHSIVQADVRGNADYVLELQPRYAYELHDGPLARWLSDFLIRSYPRQHVESFSRPLYRTPEYCGACHKQFIDEMLNQDIGMVLAQNQYDSWRGSQWHDPDDITSNVSCRECHMPLTESGDPSSGDLFSHDFNRSPTDRMHRSHAFPGGNQVIPLLQGLEGGAEHVRYVEDWLRGEVEIPELGDRWEGGQAVELRIHAPERVSPDAPFTLQVSTHNRKVGHEFPTGPLDVIESWVELKVVSDDGTVLHHSGGLDDGGRVQNSLIVYGSEPFDRTGERLWRHELWLMVGSRYKRSLFPAQTDFATLELAFGGGRDEPADGPVPPGTVTVELPRDMPPGEIRATAVLWYRKFNPTILELLLGPENGLTMPAQVLPEHVDLAALEVPLTDVARTSTTIRVEASGGAPPR